MNILLVFTFVRIDYYHVFLVPSEELIGFDLDAINGVFCINTERPLDNWYTPREFFSKEEDYILHKKEIESKFIYTNEQIFKNIEHYNIWWKVEDEFGKYRINHFHYINDYVIAGPYTFDRIINTGIF